MTITGNANFKVVAIDSDGEEWPIGFGEEKIDEARQMAELQAYRLRNFPNDYVQIWDCTKSPIALIWSSKASA